MIEDQKEAAGEALCTKWESWSHALISAKSEADMKKVLQRLVLAADMTEWAVQSTDRRDACTWEVELVMLFDAPMSDCVLRFMKRLNAIGEEWTLYATSATSWAIGSRRLKIPGVEGVSIELFPAVDSGASEMKLR